MAKKKTTGNAVQVDAAALLAALNNSATGRNPPITESALLQAADGRLVVTTTDTETTMRHTLACEGGTVEAVANVAQLRAALTGVAGAVLLDVDGSVLTVSQAGRRYRFIQPEHGGQGVASIFPIDDSPVLTPLEIDPKALADAMAAVQFASGAIPTPPTPAVVALVGGDVVATNAVILSLATNAAGVDDVELLLPIKSVPKLLDVLAQDDCTVHTAANSATEKAVEIVAASPVLEVRALLYTHSFPRFGTAWPKEVRDCAGVVVFSVDELAATLTRLRAFAPDNGWLDVDTTDDVLHITTPDGGTFEDVAFTRLDDVPPIAMTRISLHYMLAVLNNNKGKQMQWGQNSANEVQLLEITNNNQGRYNYVMPVRV